MISRARQDGIAEGIEKGRIEEKIETVTNMLNMGIDKTTIMKATGLTEDEITKLKENKH